MYLQEIKLNNFRNYSQLDLQFDPHLNIFIGANAQGKTNLLEAILVLALVRSHRTSNNQELIKWGTDFSRLQALVQKDQSRVSLELILSSAGKKARLNQLEQKKLSQYVGQLNVILFAPEDLNLVKGSPSVRRRFIDMEIGQIDKIYLNNISKYRQILKQRNNYLKKLRSKKTSDKLYLEVISDQLAGFGSEIIATRYQFLQKIQHFLQPIHQEITQGQENLQLDYHTLAGDPAQKVNDIYQSLLTRLTQQAQHDIAFGSTSVGPHRDDFSFVVNQKDIQKFGSQGQQRSAVLSMKLAEIDLFHQEVGDYPILLLDDVLSELDQVRQTQLLQAIHERIQTFITTTSLDNVQIDKNNRPKIFNIKAGGII
ncbi:DNA replication/repair protein RecF [Bombilactobacillus thymidiniphilus]|uniref:DNA replication and repair protein RecF n=1 Tax=Bombilactobacillus thymidiniphilus TaxID=2923363 RepID=A0ABY4PBA3_9LACO|nr:DNA replication/repair protein RecF [Bombilactobacillus thymidiniphilus]UQS82961.1 DNA replication/repair protein RecF [Bombilactobacillus thymidiniphilus]